MVFLSVWHLLSSKALPLIRRKIWKELKNYYDAATKETVPVYHLFPAHQDQPRTIHYGGGNAGGAFFRAYGCITKNNRTSYPAMAQNNSCQSFCLFIISD